MVRGWRCLAVAPIACVLLGCLHKKVGAMDGGPDDGAVAAAVEAGAAAPLVANEASVAPIATRPEPARKRAPLHCTGGQVAILVQAGEETCVTTCVKDAACSKGEVCNGSGVLSNNGAPGAETKFCEPRAGVADAGGTTPAVPAAKPLDWKPEKGQCPAGYGTCGAMCRLQCTKDADCGGAGAHCQGGFCIAPGKLPCPK